ncbi:tRNA adenosine(34) deaminase TadA [Elusimicrobiota bacterium]
MKYQRSSKDTGTKFIKEAIKEAKKAKNRGEVPVGAVIAANSKIISRGYNKSIALNDPTAHAEIIALRKASKKIGNYRLKDCKLYVTVEPCPMCAGAAVWARVSEIVFGAFDKKAGACGSVLNISDNKNLNHRIKVTGGVLEKECRTLMQKFFRKRRKLSPGVNRSRRG